MADTKAVSLYLNNKVLAVRMSVDMWRQLKTYCHEKELKMNRLIIQLLEEKYQTKEESEIWESAWRSKINDDQSINSIVINLLSNLLNH